MIKAFTDNRLSVCKTIFKVKKETKKIPCIYRKQNV